MKTIEWFKERIGQKVYRKHNFCKCDSCLNVWKHGIVIKNETHAYYLYSIELETDLNYFDKEVTMSNNKQQTAVEKLESFFRRHCNPSVCDIEWNDFNTAFLEAKEMGKDQHIKTWEAGLMKVDFNEYYNETFGGNNEQQ